MLANILRRRGMGKGSTSAIHTMSEGRIGVVRSDDAVAMAALDSSLPLIRWGCTAQTRHQGPQLNTSASIHWCNDKRSSRLAMQDAGVSVPWTRAIINGTIQLEDSDGGDGEGLLPLVARPCKHAQGRNLVVGTYSQWEREGEAPFREGYVAHLINKVAEYRVFVCRGRIAWVARKHPGNPDDVAWNVARGGRFENVRWNDWPMESIKQALSAARLSGTDFCGVDVMVDANNTAYVLEVNSAPSQTSEYRQRCTTKALLYTLENMDQTFEPPTRWRSYKDVIHPALTTGN